MVQTDSNDVQQPQPQPASISPLELISIGGKTYQNGVGAENKVDNFICLASVHAVDTTNDEDENLDEEKRAPIVLVAVVDKSGSMSGAKLENVKKTLHFIIKELGARDQLGIVEYDTSVNTTLEMTVMNAAGKLTAQNVANRLTCGSSTNLSGGLLQGLRLIPNSVEKSVASILLMTDGLANHGITSTPGIIAMMHKAQSEGIGKCTVNTFGFGSDHDAKMLKDISDAGEGMYYFIENEDSIAGGFADCLGGLLTTIGQGLELRIDAHEGITISQILTVKQLQTIVEGKSYRIALGDIQEGEERDIPFEINLPNGSPILKQPIAKLTLSYYNVKSETLIDITTDIVIDRPNTAELTADHTLINIVVDEQYNRVCGGLALDKAILLAEQQKLTEAREILQNTITKIKSSPSSTQPLCVTILSQLSSALELTADRASYTSRGQYVMNKCSKAMNYQRCNEDASSDAMEEANMKYETKAKRMMKKKWAK